ncbi:MAG: Biphenyl-2,3-diol 1,2-dioxygenase [Alphaproteobacteria bacterium MarineAlpha11_Bin1]|nr:MAG: Biphenyl-2,3-diol 1,2-dioxygenase [Alphaproteobacteria bacterium MarineAlpha11_Bin1]|tara:strand:+ start:1148 stop:1753 length:606 start_codon:yes stop_codon:yes gene_type:complete
MARGIIDKDGLNSPDVSRLRETQTPGDIPFSINKIGHVVLMVQDLEKSVEFYAKVLGFRVSDVYPASMVPGRMVFMRCSNDHHGVALVGGALKAGNSYELNHMAFEVSTIDEVFRARDHLEAHEIKISYLGRRRAGCQVAVEFFDPDNHMLEIYWGIDQIGINGQSRPPDEWHEEMSLESAVDNPPPGQDTTMKYPNLRRD